MLGGNQQQQIRELGVAEELAALLVGRRLVGARRSLHALALPLRSTECRRRRTAGEFPGGVGAVVAAAGIAVVAAAAGAAVTERSRPRAQRPFAGVE